MKARFQIGCCLLVLLMAACTTMSESRRMEAALEQGALLYGQGENDTLVFVPELDHAAGYFAGKKQYGKAAHAALYNGYAQVACKDKPAAMQSFKEAEHYGDLANDSLTVAWAQFNIGKMLLVDGKDEEVLPLLVAALQGFGDCYSAKAQTQNLIAIYYIGQHDYENSLIYLQQGLSNATLAHSQNLKIKILNNFAVLYRLQGEYDQSIHYLKQIKKENLNEADLLLNYMNLGITYFAKGEMDSAAYYYQFVEPLTASNQIKKESKVSAFGALSRFAEEQGDPQLALQYWKKYSKYLDEVRNEYERNNVYLIQQKYDYDALQNAMDKRIIQRQRVISILAIITGLILVALAIVQIRLANIKKKEAEVKTNLLRFMRQNEDLLLQNEENKKTFVDLEQKYKENLSMSWRKEQHVMQKLAVFLGNKEDAALLQALTYTVFGSQGFWNATIESFDRQFPGLRGKLAMTPYGLTEKEQKTLILLYLDASREDTALLLKTSVAMVDKMRSSAKKKLPSQANSSEESKK